MSDKLTADGLMDLVAKHPFVLRCSMFDCEVAQGMVSVTILALCDPSAGEDKLDLIGRDYPILAEVTLWFNPAMRTWRIRGEHVYCSPGTFDRIKHLDGLFAHWEKKVSVYEGKIGIGPGSDWLVPEDKACFINGRRVNPRHLILQQPFMFLTTYLRWKPGIEKQGFVRVLNRRFGAFVMQNFEQARVGLGAMFG